MSPADRRRRERPVGGDPPTEVAEVSALGQPTGADRLDPAKPRRLAPEDYAGLVLLAVMVAIMLISVAGRFLPTVQIPYADQMLPDLLVWLALLGTVSALRWREHLGMSALVDRLPTVAQRGISLLISVVSVGFFAVLLVFGMEIVAGQYASGLSSPAGYPSWLVALAFPVCAGLALLRLAVNIWRSVGARPQGPAANATASTTSAGRHERGAE